MNLFIYFFFPSKHHSILNSHQNNTSVSHLTHFVKQNILQNQFTRTNSSKLTYLFCIIQITLTTGGADNSSLSNIPTKEDDWCLTQSDMHIPFLVWIATQSAAAFASLLTNSNLYSGTPTFHWRNQGQLRVAGFQKKNFYL